MKNFKGKMFLALLLVSLQIMCAVPVQAELVTAQQEIRVGLTELYSGKETLTIYNNKLGYGYCVDNVYLQEAVLESSSGFVFTPVNGYFIAGNKEYGSYQAALQAAEQYRNLGVEAYPGSTYQCCWQVYFGSTEKYAEAERMVKMLEDISGVAEVRLMTELEFTNQGKHAVTIEAEDIHGNVTTGEALLWVATDFQAPRITGAEEPISIEKHGALNLMEGVTARDNKDGVCKVNCDTGALDPDVAGTYFVTYTAVDSSGNQAVVKRKITVEHDMEDTKALVREIADSLSDDPEEIRDYVRSSIRYNHDWGGDDPTWYGFTTRTGNCYVHANCLKDIFDLKGIENQMIWVENKSHYWLIVKINGVWKHIDPTPGPTHSTYSLMNDAERLSTLTGRKWDTSLWPACE